MAANRFQDLIVWQRARELTAEVYRATRDGGLARDFGLASQLQRASVSIMANLAEGFDRNRPNEFLRSVGIAKGSCAEVMSHLYVASDVGYLPTETFDGLFARCEEIGRMLGAIQSRARQDAPSR
ncbi:MAG: four helix bundle protein [Chloroflexi bacterium]|nr:four helix bundle protein [Chloroflexota bacterium]